MSHSAPGRRRAGPGPLLAVAALAAAAVLCGALAGTAALPLARAAAAPAGTAPVTGAGAPAAIRRLGAVAGAVDRRIGSPPRGLAPDAALPLVPSPTPAPTPSPRPAATPAPTPRPTARPTPVPVVRDRFRFPALGIDRAVVPFPCDRAEPPDDLVYRWGCAGANNVYLFGHAYGTFRPLHDAYVAGRLAVGMRASWADADGRWHTYEVAWWRVTSPVGADWAWAAQEVPSMTLQTCVGPDESQRLVVRLVEVAGG